MIQETLPSTTARAHSFKQLQREAFKLAFQLAEHSGDEPHTQKALQEAYSRFNAAEIGHVITKALEITVDGILAPIIEGSQLDGTDVRAMIANMKQQVDKVFND